MPKLWPIVLTIWLLGGLITNNVWAEDIEELEIPTGAQVLELRSEIGVWMPLHLAKRVQINVERARLRKLKIGELELKLDVRQERVDSCKEALATSETSRDHALTAANKMDEVVHDLENKNEAWYRKPIVWFGAGVVVTVLLEVAAIAILGAI